MKSIVEYNPKRHNVRKYMYAQIKLDGHRLKIVRARSGKITVWTRGMKLWTDQLKRVPDARLLWTRLDEPCELYVELHGHPELGPELAATDVVNAINHNPEKLTITVLQTSAVELSSKLPEVDQWCIYNGLRHAPYYVSSLYHTNRPANCLGMFAEIKDLPKPGITHPATNQSLEGYVFKKNNNPLNWIKYTPALTINLRVTGVTEGKGQHAGRVGALVCCDAAGKFVCNAGGFTLKDRLAFTENPPVGRIVEIKYKNKTRDGSLRMPRFKRIREDGSTCDLVL